MRFAYLVEPPFNFRSGNGTVTGCDVELARSVLPMAGVCDFEPVETGFAGLLPGLAEGRWRMTTGLFATEERRRVAAFSRPIWALPDGLLVRRGNPKRLTGYRSAAQTAECTLAVIRDQVQHRSALDFGMPQDRILIFETYDDAAKAVLAGHVDAYASVARAHNGFLDQNAVLELELVTVPHEEKQPAFGCFAFNRSDNEFRQAIDEALLNYLGSDHHRSMMRGFGFNDAEIDLVVAEAG